MLYVVSENIKCNLVENVVTPYYAMIKLIDGFVLIENEIVV